MKIYFTPIKTIAHRNLFNSKDGNLPLVKHTSNIEVFNKLNKTICV